MGPIWDPDGPHVGPMNLAIWATPLCGSLVTMVQCLSIQDSSEAIMALSFLSRESAVEPTTCCQSVNDCSGWDSDFHHTNKTTPIAFNTILNVVNSSLILSLSFLAPLHQSALGQHCDHFLPPTRMVKMNSDNLWDTCIHGAWTAFILINSMHSWGELLHLVFCLLISVWL